MSGDLDLIEGFLHGRLSKNELEIFEKKMSTDDAFVKLMEKEQHLIDTLSDEKSRYFVQKVQDIVQKTPMPSRNRQRNRRRISIAIAASLLLVLGLLFFFPQRRPSTEALFKTYFRSYPMLLAQRDASPGSFQDFVTVYQNEQWDEVIRLADNPDLHTAYPNLIDLYQGVAHLHKGEARKAIQILGPEKDLNADLSVAFLWYQSMAYLQLGDQSQAKETLTQLIAREPGGSWQNDAHEILKTLQ